MVAVLVSMLKHEFLEESGELLLPDHARFEHGLINCCSGYIFHCLLGSWRSLGSYATSAAHTRLICVHAGWLAEAFGVVVREGRYGHALHHQSRLLSGVRARIMTNGARGLRTTTFFSGSVC